MAIETGAAAPDFSLPDQDGKPFRLSEHRGRKLVLVFYPGDDTPVCTRQLCEYRDGIQEFADLDVDVVGISRNDGDSHRRFRDKYQLPFTLLTDQDLGVAETYDCKGLLGMKRGVFIVDEEGIVRYAHVETVSIFRRRKEELVAALATL